MDDDLRDDLLGRISHIFMAQYTETAREAALLEVTRHAYEAGRDDQRHEAKQLFEAFGAGLGGELVQAARASGNVLDVQPEGFAPNPPE